MKAQAIHAKKPWTMAERTTHGGGWEVATRVFDSERLFSWVTKDVSVLGLSFEDAAN